MAKSVTVIRRQRMRLSKILALPALAVVAMLSTNIARAQSYKMLYNFGRPPDGIMPCGTLIKSGSTFYGVTFYGGAKGDADNTIGYGTIFACNIDTGKTVVLHSFGGSADGAEPHGSLIKSGSFLYGTTVYGGAYSDDNRFIGGTIFAYNLDTGKEIVLHSFGHGTDGNIPCGSLIKLGSILYGMTSGGGAYDSGKPFSGGTIFAYNISTNAETILYSFAGGKDGANPIGALTESGSILYGVTSRGGAGRDGTIFAYNINTSMEKVLHSFGSSVTPPAGIGFLPRLRDGGVPAGSLIQSGSILYGMTQFGGANGGPNSKGTIFAYNIATGVETVLYSFTGGSDGRNPVDSLIKSGSTLYGMTEYGGSGNEGTLFAYNLDNSTETVLLSFSFRINGGIPEGSLIESGSTLYGTTGIGGHRTNGTIFALTLPKP